MAADENVIDTLLIGPFASDAKVRLVEEDGQKVFQVRDSQQARIRLTHEEARDLAAFIVRHL